MSKSAERRSFEPQWHNAEAMFWTRDLLISEAKTSMSPLVAICSKRTSHSSQTCTFFAVLLYKFDEEALQQKLFFWVSWPTGADEGSPLCAFFSRPAVSSCWCPWARIEVLRCPGWAAFPGHHDEWHWPRKVIFLLAEHHLALRFSHRRLFHALTRMFWASVPHLVCIDLFLLLGHCSWPASVCRNSKSHCSRDPELNVATIRFSFTQQESMRTTPLDYYDILLHHMLVTVSGKLISNYWSHASTLVGPDVISAAPSVTLLSKRSCPLFSAATVWLDRQRLFVARALVSLTTFVLSRFSTALILFSATRISPER